jgi:hypothetical protein
MNLGVNRRWRKQMDDTPDFLFEMSARAYAVGILVLFVVMAGLFVGLTFAVPGLRQERWWVDAQMVLIPVTLLIAGIWFVVRVARGGVYRAAIRQGRLRVDSPDSEEFGPSFEFELSAVARLVIWRNPDGGDRYEVWTVSGEAFRVYSGCGDGLFEAIRRLRPEVPVVQER